VSLKKLRIAIKHYIIYITLLKAEYK